MRRGKKGEDGGGRNEKGKVGEDKGRMMGEKHG